MATSTFYWARFGVEPAGNADLNPTVDAAIEIEFTSIDPQLDEDLTTTIDGDLILDNSTIDGDFDPNTWVSLDGGATWHEFDVLVYGVVDHNNSSLYDFSGVGGPNFNDFTLVSIQLDDGSRLIFYPTENFSETDMNLLPHGGVPLKPSPDYPTNPPPVCFVSGTMITTNNGDMPIEQLCVGDMVASHDNGMQKITWIGNRKMSGNDNPKHTPIRIKKGALGENMPTRDLLVSPQHRILVTDWRAELMFGVSEVLVAAKYLVNDGSIRVATDLDSFEYFHIMFDSHQTIFSEGLPTESFHPGDMAIQSLSEASRAEVLELFPELTDGAAIYGPATHPSLRAFEAKALQNA